MCHECEMQRMPAAAVSRRRCIPPGSPVAGSTVEMHGSVRQLVCPACGGVVKLSPPMARTLKGRKPLACGACGHAPMRMRLMLYDDAEGALRLTQL